MTDLMRVCELQGHYHDGFKKGCAALTNEEAMIEQYKKSGSMCEGWADGFREFDRGKVKRGRQVHYDNGYKRGKTAAARDESGMLKDAENEGAWREGWVDGYRGLNMRSPSVLAKKKTG